MPGKNASRGYLVLDVESALSRVLSGDKGERGLRMDIAGMHISFTQESMKEKYGE